ncbi:asparaginase [Bacillus fonticola]|uniref:asparaginase n=1 Tax=Bacillus fonticola TaxID=2728853 RepID=UPI001474F2E8|nr:asparaginase [Bacillus fonticola]
MEKAITVYRGKYIESTHNIHVAVVDTNGNLIYSYGDPNRLTFPRSSMKPFQAIPVIETGAADAFQYEVADLALICSSHNGEEMHRSRVTDILSRVTLPEKALQCGTHIPFDGESYKELIRGGGDLTSLYSNCSGKHTGMLTAVAHRGEDLDSYRELSHPHQQRILDAVETVCDFPKEEIGISVDGCGVPVHRLPLFHAALGYARLAQPVTLKDELRAQTLERIRKAMTTYPELVGGTNRFDTDLMRAFQGRIVAKEGAEAVQCIGDSETGIGIAVKVEDGNKRGTSVAMMEVLKQLGIGNERIYEQLQQYVHAPVLNARKDAIGVIQPNFTLKKK